MRLAMLVSPERMLRDRLPFAVTVAAALFAVALAVLPEFDRVPVQWPAGSYSVLLICLLAGYLVSVTLSACAAIAVALSGTVSGARNTEGFERAAPTKQDSRIVATTGAADVSIEGQLPPRREPQHDGSRDRWLAVFLAVVVVLEAGSHTGPRGGSWVTSVPRDESDLTVADGHAFWLEGWPMQEDATRFITDVDVLSGGDGMLALRGFPHNLIHTTRGTYSYLVAVLVRATGAAGSVYLAFVATNALLWWCAALAMFDLARRACRSWWAGAAAGLLTATGIGFTFMAGNPMSNAASYAGAVLVPWFLLRLGFARARTPLAVDALAACLTACAGLTYGMAPVFLAFAAWYYTGRRALGRLLFWALVVSTVGYGWEVLNIWERAPYRVEPPPSRSEWAALGALLALIGLALASPALIAPARRLRLQMGAWVRPWRVRRMPALAALLTVLLIGSVVVSACLALPAIRSAPAFEASTVVSALQLPVHELDKHFAAGAAAGGWQAVVLDLVSGTARSARLDNDLLGAFPAAVGALALVGLIGMPRRWREWCAAVAAASALVAFAMTLVSHVPHPRLVYWAYPAVYMLAASGLLNCHRMAMTQLAAHARLSQRQTRGLAGIAVAVMLAATLLPSHASLWGNWSFEHRFHSGGGL